MATVLLDVVTDILLGFLRLPPALQSAEEGFVGEARHAPTYFHAVRLLVHSSLKEMHFDIHQLEIEFHTNPE